MKTASILSALAVMSVSAAFAGRPIDVTLWRGETTDFILHDYAALGTAPAGISVRTGVAQEVRYLDTQFGTHYSSFADRVEWGATNAGVTVCEVSASPDVKPGTYVCGDLAIKVLDRTLPPAREWKYWLDLWQHPWAVARWHGVAPFSQAHYDAMRPLWQLLASAGQKALTVTLVDQPWNHQSYDAYRSMVGRVRKDDGSWAFDYRVFDEYVAFGRSCGLGPAIACYTMCPWDYLVTWQDERGETDSANAIPGTPVFEEFWGDFLVDFARHLKEKGWFEDAYIAIDERGPDDVKLLVEFLHRKAPGLKVSFAGRENPSEFAEKGFEIENCCVGLARFKDGLVEDAARRRAKGMVTTTYVCCSPRHPNTFAESQLEEAYWLGAYPAVAGLDGFLRWAWNNWGKDPMKDASYTGILTGWLPGDTYLVYPDGSPSLRFLELRNGIVAAEKMRLMKELGLFDGKSFEKLALRYNREEAMAGKSPFVRIRAETQKFVNGEPTRFSVFPFAIDAVARERGVTFDEAVRLLEEAGVSGFDCDFNDRRLGAYLAAGLKPCNLYGDMKFLAEDNGASVSRAFVDTARRIGCTRIMMLPDDFTDGEPSEAEFRKIVSGAKKLLKMARDAGVTLTCESYGCKKNCCSYAGYLKRLLSEVPGLAFTLDTGNLHAAQRGDDIVEVARFAGERLALVHLKDWSKTLPPISGKVHNYVTLGEGCIPHAELFEIVRKSGYEGWYTLEHPVAGDTLGDIGKQVSVVRGWLDEGRSKK